MDLKIWFHLVPYNFPSLSTASWHRLRSYPQSWSIKNWRVFRSYRVSNTSSSLVLRPRTKLNSQWPKFLRASIIGLRSSMLRPRMRWLIRARWAGVLHLTFSGRSLQPKHDPSKRQETCLDYGSSGKRSWWTHVYEWTSACFKREGTFLSDYLLFRPKSDKIGRKKS